MNTDSGNPERLDFRIAAAVFVLVCAAYSLLLFHFLPRGQLAKYPVAAQKSLEGTLSAERRQDYSPLYLQIHILARRISSRPQSLVSAAHVALTAASCAIVFLLIRRFFNRASALAGVAALTLDRSLIVYTQMLEPEPFLMTAILLFAWLITGPQRPARHLAAGVVLGLAVLTRPTFLPVLLVMPLYFRVHPECRTKWLASSAVFSLPVLCMVGALWIRNSFALGYFSPSVMNPGAVFFEGNNPNSMGFSSVYPPLVGDVAVANTEDSDYHHEVYREFARRITGRNLTIPEVNAYWSGLAARFLIDHPLRAAQVLSTRAFHIFHRYQWHDLSGAFWSEQWLASHRLPAVPFSLVSALAIAGVWMLRANWRRLLPLYALFLAEFALMFVLYVSARQRNSILWIFCFFAAGAAHRLCRIERRRAIVALALLLPLAWILHAPTDLMREETRLWHGIRKSNAALADAYRARSENRLSDAARASAASLAAAPFYIDSRRPANLAFPQHGFAAAASRMLQPGDPSALFDAGVLHVESGNAAEALQAWEQILTDGHRFKRDQYQSPEPYYYVARIALLQKQEERAIGFLREAEAMSPGDPSALALLSVLTADNRYADRLLRYFDEIDARFYLGRAALIAGRFDPAAQHLSFVAEKAPEYRRGRIYHAVALGLAGRLEEGVREYMEAMKMRPDPVMLEEESVELFRRWTLQRPLDPAALYTYGFVLRQFGRYAEALEVQQQAAALNPSAAIQAEMDALRKAMQQGSGREPGPGQTE